VGRNGVTRAEADAAQDVHSPWDRLHVLRIHAAAHATPMIDVEPVGDRANQRLEYEAMGTPCSLRPSLADCTVAILLDGAEPQPARGIRFRDRLVPEPLRQSAVPEVHFTSLLVFTMLTNHRTARPSPYPIQSMIRFAAPSCSFGESR
jgi:hypothetical protein